jgi:hypothetical protein
MAISSAHIRASGIANEEGIYPGEYVDLAVSTQSEVGKIQVEGQTVNEGFDVGSDERFETERIQVKVTEAMGDYFNVNIEGTSYYAEIGEEAGHLQTLTKGNPPETVSNQPVQTKPHYEEENDPSEIRDTRQEQIANQPGFVRGPDGDSAVLAPNAQTSVTGAGDGGMTIGAVAVVIALVAVAWSVIQ